MNLQPFRKELVKEVTDENGSTHAVDTNFRSNAPTKPIRHYYEQRFTSDEITLADLETRAKGLLQDAHKLDASIKLERNKIDPTKYFIVECYTVLEY